jgi:hypothetical protein
MSVQRIPFENLQKIRNHIQAALVIPNAENRPKSWSDDASGQDLPEPGLLGDLGELFNMGSTLEEANRSPNNRGKWFISTINPGAALLKLPGLKLKDNIRLVTYLYRFQEQGLGATWAVPEIHSTTALLEQALAHSDRSRHPQPQGSLEDVMDAMVGDGSPLSFVVATLLCRELRELGMLGQDCNWSKHRLLGTLPATVPWKWLINQPANLSPKIRFFQDGRAAIEFFSCRTSHPITIFQHIDQYAAKSYKATTLDRPIAFVRPPAFS